MLSLVLVLEKRFIKFSFIELINERSQTNRDQKSSLLFLQRQDQSQKFWHKLVKNRKKALQRDQYLLHWIHHTWKNWWLWKCSQCKSFVFDCYASGYIEEKNGNKYLVFDSADENKKVLKKYTDILDGIKNEIKTINGGKEND